MNKKIYAVYGASGCGRSLMPIAREQLQRENTSGEIYFIDDNLTEQCEINGHIALNYQTFKSIENSEKYILIAIANHRIREKLAQKILNDGLHLWTVIANNAIIMDDVHIASGSALSPFVTIGSNVQIGQCFHANLYSYVEHDCVIGDFVTFAPSVKCNGNVHIEDYAYIGAGAMIKQGTPDKPLRIGKGAVIGMGAVVTKDVPAGVTVVGNPARVLEK
ncbi:MAG: acetyltransferase [Acinetobacter sp.]|nr:acetyltransferase [Acinetobacter sp.]